MWQHFSPPVGSNDILSAHAKSSAGSCKQDAGPTFSAPCSGPVCLGITLSLRSQMNLLQKNLALVLWLTSLSFGFALASLKMSETN